MDGKTEQIFIVNTSEALALLGPQSSTETTQNNLQNVLTSNVCRTCAAATEFVIPIFHGEGLQNNLAEKIHKHLPIQVSEQDELPQVVCYQCASTLLAWHELVECCVQADQALRTRLAVGKAAKQQEAQPGTSTEVSTTPVQQQGEEKDKEKFESLRFNSIVQRVLSKRLQTDESELPHKFNCLECSYIIDGDVTLLARHLKFKHGLHFEATVKFFIDHNIMFEESLYSDQESIGAGSDKSHDDTPVCKEVDKKLQNFFCPFCNNIFTSASRLVFHLNTHTELHTEEGYDCTICDFKSKSRKDFVVHLQQSHVRRPLDQLKLTCRSCGYLAVDSGRLQAHVTAVHCNEELQLNKMEQQQKSIPVNNQKKKAACAKCQKIFANKYIMQHHYERHSKEYWYQCDRCPKKYKSETARRRHAELVHEGILRFVCAICGEAFATKQHRDIHTRKHTGAEPFVCQFCGKGFRAKNGLDRHMDMHFDVRNFACHLCPKKFRKRSHLNCHLGTHEKKKTLALEPAKKKDNS